MRLDPDPPAATISVDHALSVGWLRLDPDPPAATMLKLGVDLRLQLRLDPDPPAATIKVGLGRRVSSCGWTPIPQRLQ